MFELNQIVPWGRSFEDYQRMFQLTDSDLGSKILGCGDGPAEFNAKATRSGANVISCDPIYRFSACEIEQRIDETHQEVIQQTIDNQDQFVWSSIKSVEELAITRRKAMQAFLDDYPRGKLEARYVDAMLPTLPFQDHAFDLALCSHLLFLYSAHLSEEFHLKAIQELCRVAAEVRIFPLITLDGKASRYIDAVFVAMEAAGLAVTLEQVDYEFQKGANRMMRIRHRR